MTEDGKVLSGLPWARAAHHLGWSEIRTVVEGFTEAHEALYPVIETRAGELGAWHVDNVSKMFGGAPAEYVIPRRQPLYPTAERDDRLKSARLPRCGVSRRRSIEGRGVILLDHVPAGRAVCWFGGETVSTAEGNRRILRQWREWGMTHVAGLSDRKMIDGASGGNVARYTNHSCTPTAEILNDWMPASVSWYSAVRDLFPGER